MSVSQLGLIKGRSVNLEDVNTKIELFFDTVASLRIELGVIDRTINRWVLDFRWQNTPY